MTEKEVKLKDIAVEELLKLIQSPDVKVRLRAIALILRYSEKITPLRKEEEEDDEDYLSIFTPEQRAVIKKYLKNDEK